MAYDHQEQEQLEELKSWWKEHGNQVVLGVVTAAVIIAGYYGWNYYKGTQALAAAALYEQLDQAERKGDRAKTRELAAGIVSSYGATPYGAYAALSAARASFEDGNLADARKHLEWVLEHARQDEVKDIARLRLAGVLLDQKNYAEALKRLEAEPAEPMAALYADLRGDILAAQGMRAEARSAYRLALDRSEAASQYRAVIQLKLDALGEAAPAPRSK